MEESTPRLKLSEVLTLPLVAIELLTVLRLRRAAILPPVVFGASQACFPAVGLLLGGLLAAADWLLRDSVSAPLTGWLLAGLLLALTGALHADGLADTFDGVFGGATPSRRLAIMRDSAIGAFGAAALVTVLGLKATALTGLGGDHRAEILVLAPALSRWAAVVAIACFPNARPEGLGAAFHAASWPVAAPIAGGICLLACAAGLGATGAAAWALAASSGLALGAFLAARLGGLTGDTYGAVIELTETGLLITAIAWWS